jgi:hypothetical protein
MLEEVSVSAWRGLIASLDGAEFVSVAAGILGAEAYFGGALRWQLSQKLTTMTPWNQEVYKIVNAVAQWRMRMSGGCDAACHPPRTQRAEAAPPALLRRQSGTDIGILVPVAQSSIAQVQQPRTFVSGNAVQIGYVDPQTGLVVSRSPSQVLGVLYLSGDAAKPGGFFPQGIQGTIKG